MLFKKKIMIPIEISARHCHLSKEDLEKLFGVDYQLTNMRQLNQPSDFACQETVDIEFGLPGGSKKIEKVRVVGPLRAQTQVEISLTDAVGAGVVLPIKLSGELIGTAPVTLVGPKGVADLKEGLIVAKRHIHCATTEAAELKLKNNDVVSVRVGGERQITFENIIVRVKDGYKLCLHLDTDEGNAAGINKAGEGIIIK